MSFEIFITQCQKILSVPLSYVIHDNEEPDIKGENPEFINKTVA